MTTSRTPARLSALMILSCLSMTATAGDNSLRLGGFGGLALGDTEGDITLVEYERFLSGSVSLGGRLSIIDYTWEDGSEIETGDVAGLQFIAKFFPRGEQRGFYLGAGAGFFETEWDYSERDDSGQALFTESGSSTALGGNMMAGYRFMLGETLYVDPSVLFGTSFSSDAEVGAWGGIGLAVGFSF